MNEYSRIINELKSDLERLAVSSDSMLGTAKTGIIFCREALVKLRWLVLQHGFPDVDTEIQFFKQIKPVAYSHLLFYQAVFELESFRSRYDNGMLTRCMELKLKEIEQFMEEHASYVQYYNCGFTYLDSLYFVRDRDEIPFELRGNHQLMDEQFNTWQDHIFAVIAANYMLSDYLRYQLFSGKGNPENTESIAIPKTKWTGNKIDLAELIYALYYAGVVEHGRTPIKEMAALFETIFDVRLGQDIYRYFSEIQQRKIEPTKFLRLLRDVLTQHIEDKFE